MSCCANSFATRRAGNVKMKCGVTSLSTGPRFRSCNFCMHVKRTEKGSRWEEKHFALKKLLKCWKPVERARNWKFYRSNWHHVLILISFDGFWGKILVHLLENCPKWRSERKMFEEIFSSSTSLNALWGKPIRAKYLELFSNINFYSFFLFPCKHFTASYDVFLANIFPFSLIKLKLLHNLKANMKTIIKAVGKWKCLPRLALKLLAFMPD